jgi:hypothetical protein
MGCGPSLPHPPYTPQATNALARVEFAPPPGRVELIPPKPPQADAWVDGEWIPRHDRWYWLLGRWVKTPPGATYSPWVVVRAIDGDVYYARSVWKDRNGAPIPPPPGIAFATGDSEAVFDAAGEAERTGRNIKTAPLPTQGNEPTSGDASTPGNEPTPGDASTPGNEPTPGDEPTPGVRP